MGGEAVGINGGERSNAIVSGRHRSDYHSRHDADPTSCLLRRRITVSHPSYGRVISSRRRLVQDLIIDSVIIAGKRSEGENWLRSAFAP